MPVCDADRAWWFGRVPSAVVAMSPLLCVKFASDDCALFCTLLGSDGPMDAPLRVPSEGRKCAHVFPCFVELLYPASCVGMVACHPNPLLLVHVRTACHNAPLYHNIPRATKGKSRWPVNHGQNYF